MRETVQGVKRVGPRRSKSVPAPVVRPSGLCRIDLFTGTARRGDSWRPPAASGGPSRTPRPTGCAVIRAWDFSVLSVGSRAFILRRVPGFFPSSPARS